MYVSKDAKITTLISSLTGLIFFVFLYVLSIDLLSDNPNFEILQLIIFTVSTFFMFLLIFTVIALIKDKKLKEEHLKNIRLQQKIRTTKKDVLEEKIKVSYNKWGLISLIISSGIGVVVFLYIYSYFANADNNISDDIYIDPSAIQAGSQMVFIFLSLLMIVLIFSIFSLIKKIQNPVFYEYMPCPDCGSKDIEKVEYAWSGGLLASVFHMARCKKCGKAYNGATGGDLKKYNLVIGILFVIFIILQIIRLIFSFS